MDIIGLVIFIALLFAALSLLERRDRRAGRVPNLVGSDGDRDAARLRTELAANHDHHGATDRTPAAAPRSATGHGSRYAA